MRLGNVYVKKGEFAFKSSLKLFYGAYVKGGHGDGERAVDVLFDGKEVSEFSAPRIANPVSTHGTGCSLAAALAAELALGAGLADAVAGAKKYVFDAISRSYYVGDGCGVLASRRA